MNKCQKVRYDEMTKKLQKVCLKAYNFFILPQISLKIYMKQVHGILTTSVSQIFDFFHTHFSTISEWFPKKSCIRSCSSDLYCFAHDVVIMIFVIDAIYIIKSQGDKDILHLIYSN